MLDLCHNISYHVITYTESPSNRSANLLQLICQQTVICSTYVTYTEKRNIPRRGFLRGLVATPQSSHLSQSRQRRATSPSIRQSAVYTCLLRYLISLQYSLPLKHDHSHSSKDELLKMIPATNLMIISQIRHGESKDNRVSVRSYIGSVHQELTPDRKLYGQAGRMRLFQL